MRTSIYLILLVFIAACDSDQSLNQWRLLIHENDTWRYYTSNDSIPIKWSKQEYNDLDWLEAKGGFGYGDEDDYTTIDSVKHLLLRIGFEIDSIEEIEQLVLHADYDDAFIAYINGKEIWRSNLSYSIDSIQLKTKPDYGHEARLYRGGHPEYFESSKNEFINSLNPGKNNLAIHVLNNSKTSSDLSARFFLTAKTNLLPNPTNKELPSWFIPPVHLETSRLPIVSIDTEEQKIIDNPKVKARMKIIHQTTKPTDSSENATVDYDGQIGIELRGSSSQKRFLKKSYGLEIQKPDGSNLNHSLLAMPKENDWVLYGPLSDKSLLRNDLAYELYRQLGNYAPRTEFCEVLINDKYQGLYVLMEKIKRDKHRVDIPKYDAEKEDLNFLIKIDKKTGSGGQGWYSSIQIENEKLRDLFFQYEYPKADKLNETDKQKIQTTIENFEQRLASDTFTDPDKGYRSLINVNSFIDLFILNEMSFNVDAYRLSSFLYLDKKGKINVGPPWDFNLSFGNGFDCARQNTTGLMIDFNKKCDEKRKSQIPFWWHRLLEDPYFVDLLNQRWNYLRKNILSLENIFSYIDKQTNYIQEARIRNFQKWRIEDQKTWFNLKHTVSYEEEIKYMKDWIIIRTDWLDQHLKTLL